jgi:triacylglycerol lipase
MPLPLAVAATRRGADAAGGEPLWPWLALAAALVATAVLLLRLRRAVRDGVRTFRRRRRCRPRHPVVLVHGLLGFGEIRLGGTRHDYFRGVRDRLAREGVVVHCPCVPKTASVAARAADLAAFVETLPGRRVNVVGHSMGGLDARFAVGKLGLARKVASVTTIGTPHLGTPIADVGAALADRMRVFAALSRLGLDLDAFQDLTTARMEAFNRAVPDARGVDYASVVGVVARKVEVNPLLLPTFVWLGERAGPSDGVVPAASQRWGEVIRTIEADHWAQIGWSRRFDAAGFYVELLRELAARGL